MSLSLPARADQPPAPVADAAPAVHGTDDPAPDLSRLGFDSGHGDHDGKDHPDGDQGDHEGPDHDDKDGPDGDQGDHDGPDHDSKDPPDGDRGDHNDPDHDGKDGGDGDHGGDGDDDDHDGDVGHGGGGDDGDDGSGGDHDGDGHGGHGDDGDHGGGDDGDGNDDHGGGGDDGDGDDDHGGGGDDHDGDDDHGGGGDDGGGDDDHGGGGDDGGGGDKLADVELEKLVDDPTPPVGSEIVFTITVVNRGPAAATGLEVLDRPDPGFTYVSHTGPGQYDPATGTWVVGALDADGQATLRLTVRVEATGPYRNEAEVVAADVPDPDSVPGDGTGDDFDSVTVEPEPIGPDTDGDGIPDSVDLDDDNDGLPDTIEGDGLTDHDGDGLPDSLDTDSDGDGIPDTVEAGSRDDDGDGEIDGFVDTNDNGLDDRVEADPLPRPDFDADGLTDELDIDADADGITDAREAGPVPNIPIDNDGDGRPDYADIDADNDGIVDIEEAQPEGAYVPPGGVDVDRDGLDDAYDEDTGSPDPTASAGVEPVNTDGADTPDYLDLDTDDDTVPDTTEGSDANLDGQPDNEPTGADADHDGLDDGYDLVVGPTSTPDASNAPRQDADGDGTRDWRDPDDDNDGLPTIDEDPNGNGDPTDDDSDGDGTPDYLDPDAGGSGSETESIRLEGVVYATADRTPVPNAVITLVDDLGRPLPAACFSDIQQNQQVGANGAYGFDIVLDADPACRDGATYTLSVDAPAGFLDPPSMLLPPLAPLDPTGSTSPLRVQPQPTPPQPGDSTAYHLSYTLEAGDPDIVNNHIPLDSADMLSVALTKRADRLEVGAGELVRYAVTIENTGTNPLNGLTLVDRLPPGFSLLADSVRLEGEDGTFTLESVQPMTVKGIALAPSETKTLGYVLQVGAGVTGGRYRNTVGAMLADVVISNEASATVTVAADPELEQATIVGKVFDDRNANGRQDPGEEGVPGARLATVTGLLIETDPFGRFHIAAEDVPNFARGRNFYLKLDLESLPDGTRETTENPRVKRITQGTLNRFDFGVALPGQSARELSSTAFVDLGDVLFEPGTTVFTPAGAAAVANAADRLRDYDCGTVTVEGFAGSCPIRVEGPMEFDLTTHFGVLSDALTDADRQAIDAIAAAWPGRDIIRVQVTGHASSEPIRPQNRHLFADNYVLSEARARSVGRYLGGLLGVPEGRIEIVGRGPDEPIADNSTEAGRILNRRAEVRIFAGAYEHCPIADYAADSLAAERTLSVAYALSDSLGTGAVCRVAPSGPSAAFAESDADGCEDCGGFVISTQSTGLPGTPDVEPRARTADVTAELATPALDRGRVRLREDEAVLDRRLAVSAPELVTLDAGTLRGPVVFTTLTNYPGFIRRMELAIYARADADRALPLARLEVPVAPYARVSWTDERSFDDGAELVAVLKAYGDDGAVDEAAPIGFKLVPESYGGRVDSTDSTWTDLHARPAPRQQQILIDGSRIRIDGEAIPAGASVEINGDEVPVDRAGSFATEYLVPPGHYDFAVTVTDAEGSTEHRLPVDVEPDYLFVAALADFTASSNDLDGAVEPLSGDERYTEETLVEGRLALYLKGKIRGRYLMTAQVDTGEEEANNLVDRLDEKDPRAMFRHLDPDRYYPVYGDDSTTIDDTDSLGKFYVRVDWDRSRALWGNYHTNLTDTEFAQYARSLYGAELEYQSRAINTVQEEPRAGGTLFASEAQTALAHDEFLGTGGSLYYLRNSDVLPGSEKARVEIRERDTDRVLENLTLVRGVDYEIDELQGRILLAKPLNQFALQTAPSIVRDTPVDGDRALLLVDYEYVPSGFDADNLTAGGRGRFWASDHVRLGATYVNESRDGGDYTLAGVDLTLQAGEGTYLKVEGASTEASQTNVYFSDNGGLSFGSTNRIDPVTGRELAGPRDGDAVGIEGRINFREQGITERDWTGAAWWRRTDAGFSIARRDLGVATEESGFELSGEIGDRLELSARASSVEAAGQFDSDRVSLQLDQTEGRNRLSGELRHTDDRDLAAGTGVEGTLAALKYTRTVSEALDLYAVAQKTIDDDGGRYADNDLIGVGARARVADRMAVTAEYNDGDRGNGSLVSLDYRMTPDRTVYGTYTMSADRTYSEPYREQFAVGQRSAISNQTKLFTEMQFVDDDAVSGIAHVFGLDFGVGETWGVGFSAQQGELAARSGAVDRDAFGITGSFEGERWRWRSAWETRTDSGAEMRRQVVTSHRIDRIFNDAFRMLFRLNLADTADDLDALEDARFVEGSIGLAYRPASNDRLNYLAKYTVLEDLPSFAQTRADRAQRSEILSFEAVYRLNDRWDLGGKLARRHAEVRETRTSGPWYDADADLFVLRGTYHMLRRWDGLAEYRILDVSTNDGRRTGFLVGVDRQINDRLKLGLGYNFTDFSDDLRVLDYDRKGWFLNVVGKY